MLPLLLLFLSDEVRDSSHASPLARSLFAAARGAGEATTADEQDGMAELANIAAAVRRAARRNADASPAYTLNLVIFDELGFVREVDDADIRYVLLPSVLKSHRGNCVGLGSLYLALGEMLGWRVEAVMVPGHFFVRVEGSNVELLRRGERMPDSWYEQRFPIPGRSAPEYARPLCSSEVLGIVEYDIANQRRRQGRLPEARGAFERACHDFPDFAEAHASLGATLHLLGALDEALTAYQTALRAHPHLPGLARNIELLEKEQRAGRLIRED